MYVGVLFGAKIVRNMERPFVMVIDDVDVPASARLF